MTDLESLLLILGGIYLSECVLWVRRDAAVFRRWFGPRVRFFAGNRLPGGENGGLLLANPLPPFGCVLVAQQYPVSLGLDGVLAFAAQSIPPAGRNAQTRRFVAYRDMRAVKAADNVVKIDGDTFVATGSTELATHLSRQIAILRDLPRERRAQAIDAELARAFDVDAIRAEFGAAERATALWTWPASLQFALVFAVLPGSLALGVLEWTWPFLALGVVSASAWTTSLVWRYCARTAPRDRWLRWRAVLLVGLSPLASIRARDSVLKNLCATRHPLAVAAALCEPDESVAIVHAFLRDAHHPYLPEELSFEGEAAECETWWRARLVQALEHCARRVAPELRAPDPLASDCVAYCARCLRQFVRAEGTCESCGGVRLSPFDRAQPLVSA